MIITVHRVVLARGDHHAGERELWHHDFRCDADAAEFVDRLSAVPPVRDGREHVDVLTLRGDESDPLLMPDEVLERYIPGPR